MKFKLIATILVQNNNNYKKKKMNKNKSLSPSFRFLFVFGKCFSNFNYSHIICCIATMGYVTEI